MRWKRTVLLAVMLLAAFTAGAVAASQVEKVTAFIRHDFQVLLNGKKAEIGNILIVDGTSYLPLRSMGNLLDADVSFEAATNTIHVKKQIPSEQAPSGPSNGKETPTQPEPGEDTDGTDTNVVLDSTALVYTNAYTITYNGRDYPIFSITDSNNKLYFRDRDLQRANINTGSAKKTKEAVTKEIYVSEAELKRIMNPDPKYVPYYNRMVIGEDEPERLNALVTYIEEVLPMIYEHTDPELYFPIPYILLVERIEDNKYELLVMEGHIYKRYFITMRKDQEDSWAVSGFRSEHLGTAYDYDGYYSF